MNVECRGSIKVCCNLLLCVQLLHNNKSSNISDSDNNKQRHVYLVLSILPFL
jgi:hypothetical protein